MNPFAARAASPRRSMVTRRIAANSIAGIGVLNLLSALTPPLRGRLRPLLDVVPLLVPQTAAALVALLSVSLIVLARGILRGQHRAWAIALVLLFSAAVLDLLKGFDVEEALITSALAVYLVLRRGAFAARTDQPSLKWGFAALVLGPPAAIGLGTLAIEVSDRPRPSIAYAISAAASRLVGLAGPVLPDRVEDFVGPAMLGAGFGLIVIAGWLVLRPAVAHRAPSGDLERARRIVARHGGDTLSYFALRDDKHWFFDGHSVVAYAVFGSVCLVSPDPIGPVSERQHVWERFHAFADGHGWAVAVLGATEDWLTVYRDAGMRDLYIGDEAVVDCVNFTLDCPDARSIRQAVNRVARGGYHVEFFDPATIDPARQPALRALMAEGRQGDEERGFSMTLGRIFDHADQGLLLAVAYGSDGAPAAMCQYVPAPDIGGYSLDLMRRSLGKHPNGLIDFVVVETIHRLQQEGSRSLGLNFATMRAVLAGEAGDGIGVRLQRWLLERFSESMQIASLWRFTEKYVPSWRPRYAVYDAPEHFAAAVAAVARAESVTELPLVGRFLHPVPAR